MTTFRPYGFSISAPAIALLGAWLCTSAPASAHQPAGEGSPQGHGVAVAQAPQPARRSPAPADAYCYIGWPNDGEIVKTTRIKVWFGTRNFGVAPAGVSRPNTGHHHLLIDTPLPNPDEAIPNDRNHLHFGLGQTEAVIELAPGTHTLQLLMGDADHVPHDPPVMSKKITIQVRGGPGVAEAR
jgi:hypothetical protein